MAGHTHLDKKKQEIEMSKKVKAKNNLAKDVKTEPNMPVQLGGMSLLELKALAYDIIGTYEKSLADLKMVNSEITKRKLPKAV